MYVVNIVGKLQQQLGHPLKAIVYIDFIYTRYDSLMTGCKES